MTKDKIISIQILRALACLLVLQLHLIPKIPFTEVSFFGAIGVDIFFIISGYIIAASIYKIDGNFQWLKFLTNRFCRVVPYYWLLTAAAAILIFLFNKNHLFEPKRFIYSLSFLPQKDPTLPMGWILNHEIFFYLFVGLSSLFIKKDKSIYIGYLFLTFLLLTHFIPGNAYWKLFLKSSINFTFLLGYFTFFFQNRIVTYFKTNFSLVLSLLIFCIVISVTCDFPKTNNHIDEYYMRDMIFFQSESISWGIPRFVIWGLPSYLVFISILAKENAIKDRFKNSFIVLIGDASYTIYLVQFFIITVILHFNYNNPIIPVLGFFFTILISSKMMFIENFIANKAKQIIYMKSI